MHVRCWGRVSSASDSRPREEGLDDWTVEVRGVSHQTSEMLSMSRHALETKAAVRGLRRIWENPNWSRGALISASYICFYIVEIIFFKCRIWAGVENANFHIKTIFPRSVRTSVRRRTASRNSALQQANKQRRMFKKAHETSKNQKLLCSSLWSEVSTWRNELWQCYFMNLYSMAWYFQTRIG